MPSDFTFFEGKCPEAVVYTPWVEAGAVPLRFLEEAMKEMAFAALKNTPEVGLFERARTLYGVFYFFDFQPSGFCSSPQVRNKPEIS